MCVHNVVRQPTVCPATGDIVVCVYTVVRQPTVCLLQVILFCVYILL